MAVCYPELLDYELHDWSSHWSKETIGGTLKVRQSFKVHATQNFFNVIGAFRNKTFSAFKARNHLLRSQKGLFLQF